MGTRNSWAFFAGCMLIALTALSWVTSVVLNLETLERESSQRAIVEENTRLALWRVDSVMSIFIARESARPHFAYSSFYPVQLAMTRSSQLLQKGEILVPSNLLGKTGDHILLHFQSQSSGELSSPQVPTGVLCDVAEQSDYAKTLSIADAGKRLSQLKKFYRHDLLVKKLNTVDAFMEMGSSYFELNLKNFREDQKVKKQTRYDTSQYSSKNQEKRSKQEWGARSFNNRRNQEAYNSNKNVISKTVIPKSKRVAIEESVMQAIWLGEELILARKVKIGGQVFLQGCWLDWKALKAKLENSLTDLLPEATLAASLESVESSTRMASIPVLLNPGTLPIDPGLHTSPRAVSLAVAWGCCLIAALALAALLRGLLSLSERRGAFVSAVTHELRTPLTTFRVYTEMLAEGMVSSEEKKQKYLLTLKREAERLAHLVNNVLAFAKLEGGRSPTEFEEMSVESLIERVTRSLPDVVARADIPFDTEVNALAENLRIRTDASLIEQILVNLVDNACKYGRAEKLPKIIFQVTNFQKVLVLTVRDNGPGIVKGDKKRIFTPFFKSATEAAHSAPGVGLGLALSKRLAKQLGGRLEIIEDANPGVGFSVLLPLEG
jgi:signal transduction histidine kinase